MLPSPKLDDLVARDGLGRAHGFNPAFQLSSMVKVAELSSV
jgi:hypothetical protein